MQCGSGMRLQDGDLGNLSSVITRSPISSAVVGENRPTALVDVHTGA